MEILLNVKACFHIQKLLLQSLKLSTVLVLKFEFEVNGFFGAKRMYGLTSL